MVKFKLVTGALLVAAAMLVSSASYADDVAASAPKEIAPAIETNAPALKPTTIPNERLLAVEWIGVIGSSPRSKKAAIACELRASS